MVVTKSKTCVRALIWLAAFSFSFDILAEGDEPCLEYSITPIQKNFGGGYSGPDCDRVMRDNQGGFGSHTACRYTANCIRRGESPAEALSEVLTEFKASFRLEINRSVSVQLDQLIDRLGQIERSLNGFPDDNPQRIEIQQIRNTVEQLQTLVQPQPEDEQ